MYTAIQQLWYLLSIYNLSSANLCISPYVPPPIRLSYILCQISPMMSYDRM